ncbi:dehydrogenase/reductase SDR family protein 7-like isoform X2 [Ischnura elegans]|uniref:dehydrogenase/reductase SDR family protein 7-like isoform X2 n=1 Tax=Ischnura elegans TaxID=197161 RepID=UPI001ED881B2|nr:dehydrogenase/reductase SDR family protein 7-like isoform X2 [Ischnura elegans]
MWHFVQEKCLPFDSIVVLITGASSGLGEALAHSFYLRGCRLILAARRKDELERVKKDLLRLNHQVGVTYPPVTLLLDLSDMNSLPKFTEDALAIHGQVDILINNAGIGHRGDAVSTSMDVHAKLMIVNYLGQVALTKALVPAMLEKHSGHIVAISSVQGRFALPYRSAYSASKHALQAFCDSLRAEVADSGISVTVVSPGYIKTSLSLNALTPSGTAHGVMDETTAAGMSPEKLADMVVNEVAKGQSGELIVSGTLPHLAILLRTLMPSVYFWIMNNRARRLKKEYIKLSVNHETTEKGKDSLNVSITN